MDFLSANWVWLLLGLALAWMLSRGGRACGFGGRGSDRSTDARTSKSGTGDDDRRHEHAAVDGNGSSGPRPRDAEGIARSRRQGC